LREIPTGGAAMERGRTNSAYKTAQNDTMGAPTIKLPDEKYRRLKILAQSRGTSVNRLIDEMATQILAEFDAETRFQLRAERGAGNVERGLELLEKAGG
jgi:predicted transcriptional regulator